MSGSGKSIKDVMFHAGDDAKHDVYWSEIGQCWTIENEDGWIANCPHLCAALTGMHLRTAHTLGGEEYRMAVPNNWRVTENHYA